MKPGAFTVICACLGLAFLVEAQTTSPVSNAAQKETSVAEHAKGAFEVKVTPQAPEDKDDPNLAGFC